MSDKDFDGQDDLRPEYAEAELGELLEKGVRGKYVERYHQGTNLIKLAPDVAAAFPTEQSVNEALRRLLESGHIAALYNDEVSR
jgi:hypothetical protein